MSTFAYKLCRPRLVDPAFLNRLALEGLSVRGLHLLRPEKPVLAQGAEVMYWLKKITWLVCALMMIINDESLS